MNRFFSPSSNISADKIIIEDKEQAHHIKNVIRLKSGEKVIVFDENENEYICVIDELKDKIYLSIKEKSPAAKMDKKIKLTVACAIPKKAKIDDIIDKLVQLGVYRIIPLKTERVVVKLDKHKEALRYERWKKIALSAAKQCKRNNLAIIDPVASFKDLIKRSQEFDLKLIPTLEEASSFPLRLRLAVAMTTVPVYHNVLVLIGPEGDFSQREVNSAIDAGFIPVTFGDLVLRVDTAAIAVASYIKLIN